MSAFLTLVAADKDQPVTQNHIRTAIELCENPIETKWLAENKAIDLALNTRLNKSTIVALREAFAADKIDVFVTDAQNRRKKLLLADMDSTIVTDETLDEIAAFAGIKDQIAEITARAMRGELDFKEALDERVGLLKDLPTSALDKTLAVTKLSPGAETFVKTMAKHSAKCVLVSGGFTFFTAPIATQAGFHHNHGNTLLIENEKLTGKVGEPILDKHAKLSFLKSYAADLGIDLSEALTIGDGANDLPMLEAAGLGLGYHPKPVLEDALDNCIIHGDLTAGLYAQGYEEADFI